MCTALTYQTRDHYFGRNLDLEYSYQEEVTMTPRNFPFYFRMDDPLFEHHGMIGIATVVDGYPLYYDATNEYGLSIAGLNFPGNAKYYPPADGKFNIAPFELIPWLLGKCKNLDEARNLLKNTNLIDLPFTEKYPLTPLHWIIADQQGCITVESTADGLNIYENTVGILTNNPPFDYHILNLQNYINLTRDEPVNRFSSGIALTPYSRGMGAIGLPGDLSSASRFVRATFTKFNSESKEDELSSIGQFFHILDAVSMTKGCMSLESGYEKTVYSSCCNMDKGIYYYTTYDNRQITAVHMHHADLNGAIMQRYPLTNKQRVYYEN